MRIIREIQYKEVRHDKQGNPYKRTYALLEDGEEAVGYGDEFKVGDKVMVFHDPKYDVIKMRLS